jgi:hypothetical protein
MTTRAFGGRVLAFGLLAVLGIGGSLMGQGPARDARADRPPKEAERRLEAQRARIRRLAGEVLARLDRVEQLKALLAEQRAATERAEAEFERARKVVEGLQLVAEGHINEIAPQELKTAEGELALAKSELARAQERLDWSERMVKKGNSPQSELLADQQEHLKAKIAVQNASDKLRVLKDPSRPKLPADLRADLDQAKAEVQGWKAELEQSKANLAQLERQIKDESLNDQEARSLARLDEAAQLAIRWRAALGGPKPAEAEAIADQAEAKLDEAEQLWQEVRDAETFRRLHEAARRLAKP